MATIIYITGGERSGKSTFAHDMALELSQNPIYLATARAWDDDFKERIERHKSSRDHRWTTIEEEKELSKHDFTGKVVVMDCVTLWLNNFHFDNEYNTEKTLKEAKDEFLKFIQKDFTLFVISNELGMGAIAERESTRKFIELQGWINQFIAKLANEAYWMVSGIPVKIKG
jgi:adenosylcobinamide kinase / adenosylcobinamide-phosphate guanylyltransferase